MTKSLVEIEEYLAEESSLKEMEASQLEEKVVVSIRCHRESEGGVAAWDYQEAPRLHPPATPIQLLLTSPFVATHISMHFICIISMEYDFMYVCVI